MTEALAVITITLLAVISPGPDFAMVTRNSLVLSRRAGVLTAWGIGSAVLVHVGYTLLGIGVLIQRSLWWFEVFKWIGAAYLVYLGIGMLRTRRGSLQLESTVRAVSDGDAWRTGFLTNLLNPKCMVFVVSLFMQVVQPGTPLATQIAYGVFIAVAHIGWFSLVATSLSAGPVRTRLLSVRHWVDRVCGGLMVALGVALVRSVSGR
ncbi:LysE family translocator [Cupriavidus nantongensis]|uniref:Amino acid transporter n=1 Tax=Cupriavidus nantongensis TaxID=1796606 RepID=A0A142JK97_9BURK|nr:LysE family transporter [Cupriavidus nantongensis]AMR78509.1 amino acid transporter [Cupriavidus nantongensis]